MSRIDRDVVAAELAEKADELRTRLGVLTAPIESDATIGFGKRIGDGTTQAISQREDASSAASLAGLLAQVERAQEKLARGSYGLCDVCGEPIDPDRLEFRPWSTTCVSHAA